ncbi:hypothetical protein K440DRAFT_621923 [Wilcoxina mikolae CBS 423.85]|nr:hypothetical protein K440DRAFT_621923 [Wilcoxina mikolae CBS 423.85]
MVVVVGRGAVRGRKHLPALTHSLTTPLPLSALLTASLRGCVLCAYPSYVYALYYQLTLVHHQVLRPRCPRPTFTHPSPHH